MSVLLYRNIIHYIKCDNNKKNKKIESCLIYLTIKWEDICRPQVICGFPLNLTALDKKNTPIKIVIRCYASLTSHNVPNFNNSLFSESKSVKLFWKLRKKLKAQ